MVPVRKTVTIKDGVAVDLLVTPHLAVYEEGAGIKPLSATATNTEVWERYADLMYLAALNAWELDGHGTTEDFPHTRGDFHALMQSDPKAFAQTVRFFVCALTGKTEKELAVAERKEEKREKEEAGEVKKKSFLYRLTHRSRRSS